MSIRVLEEGLRKALNGKTGNWRIEIKKRRRKFYDFSIRC